MGFAAAPMMSSTAAVILLRPVRSVAVNCGGFMVEGVAWRRGVWECGSIQRGNWECVGVYFWLCIETKQLTTSTDEDAFTTVSDYFTASSHFSAFSIYPLTSKCY